MRERGKPLRLLLHRAILYGYTGTFSGGTRIAGIEQREFHIPRYIGGHYTKCRIAAYSIV